MAINSIIRKAKMPRKGETHGKTMVGHRSSISILPIAIPDDVRLAPLKDLLLDASRKPTASLAPYSWNRHSPHTSFEDAQVLVVRFGRETLDPRGLPARFLYDDLFGLDTNDPEAVVDFVSQWGVAPSPYKGSRERFFQGIPHYQLNRVIEGARGAAWLKSRRSRAKGWNREKEYIEEAHSELSVQLSVAPKSESTTFAETKLADAAIVSEFLRRALAVAGAFPEGCYVVSLDEVSAMLELLKECSAVLLATDIFPSDKRSAFAEAAAFGAFPDMLVPSGRSMFVDLKDALAKRRKRPVADILEETVGKWPDGEWAVAEGAFDRSALRSASRFFTDVVCANPGAYFNLCPQAEIRTYGQDVPTSEARRLSDAAAAIVWATSMVLDDDARWQRCKACGKAFKRKTKAGSLLGEGKGVGKGGRKRESNYCTDKCQLRARRHAKADVSAFAKGFVESRFPEIAQGGNAAMIALNELASEVRERFPDAKEAKDDTALRRVVEKAIKEAASARRSGD